MYQMLQSKQINPWEIKADQNATEILMTVKYEYDGLQQVQSSNMLGLVMFSVVFGAILGQLGDIGQPMVVFFEIFLEVIMRIITLVIW